MHGDNKSQVAQGTECTVKQSRNPGDNTIITPTNGALSSMSSESTPLTLSAMIIVDSTTPTLTDYLAKRTCLAKSTEEINKNMHDFVILNSLASQIGNRILWEDDMVFLGSSFQEPLVRRANSELELSQLLFISIRQRELIRVLAVLGLSTYTTFSWFVHSLPVIPTKLYDIM